MHPVVAALARRFRVLTFSLAGEKGSDTALPSDAAFDTYIDQIDRVFDTARESSATICGISFGGLIAFRYARLRPHRVAPVDSGVSGPARFRAERPIQAVQPGAATAVSSVLSRFGAAGDAGVVASFPKWSDRLHQAVHIGRRVLSAPTSPATMGRRIESMRHVNFADGGAVAAPTLILVGEDGLDRTVPPETSRRYCALIPQAEFRTLERTGHLGTVTRPDTFAAEVMAFVDRARGEGVSRERRKVAL